MTGIAMSQWTSVCLIDDLGPGSPPIIYRGRDHLPRRTDDRGGMFYCDAPASAPHDFLRVGAVTDDLCTATVVLDRSQVIALAARLYEWLQAGGGPTPAEDAAFTELVQLGQEMEQDPKALNRATGEVQPTMVFP